jgi:transcription initiation factor TFIID subunit TAF12
MDTTTATTAATATVEGATPATATTPAVSKSHAKRKLFKRPLEDIMDMIDGVKKSTKADAEKTKVKLHNKG